MSYYYERVHATNQELEAAYDTHMKNGAYNDAYQCAQKGQALAKSVMELQTGPAYMREIYKTHYDAWTQRAQAAEKGATVSASPSEGGDSSTTYKPTVDMNKSDITFEDIAGLTDVKEMLRNKVILPLEKPDVVSKYKKKPTRTVRLLLYGPPGTGKTMFCEALANELNMTVHRCKASEIVGSLLGESARNLKAFIESVLADPSERIMAFIDEFDAIAGARGSNTSGADGEMNRLVNELLQSIDAMTKSDKNRVIVFVATTNLPENIDPAILRGKRLDTHIYVGLPDREARRALVQKALGGGIPPLAADVDLQAFADSLKGYSAADISSMCEKISDEPAFRHCLTDKPDCVTVADIKKIKKMTPASVTAEELNRYYEYNAEHGYVTPILT